LALSDFSPHAIKDKKSNVEKNGQCLCCLILINSPRKVSVSFG